MDEIKHIFWFYSPLIWKGEVWFYSSGPLKNITKWQNIYTAYNNFENGKSPQTYNEKYQKCPEIWHTIFDVIV